MARTDDGDYSLSFAQARFNEQMSARIVRVRSLDEATPVSEWDDYADLCDEPDDPDNWRDEADE